MWLSPCRTGISILGGRGKESDDHVCKILPNCLVRDTKVFDLVIPLWGTASQKTQRKNTNLCKEVHDGFTERTKSLDIPQMPPRHVPPLPPTKIREMVKEIIINQYAGLL